LRSQLKLLEKLQGIDGKIMELESSLRALPQKLKGMQDDLAKVEALLERERGQLAEAERWRREQELELKSDEESLQKSKNKAGVVKNSREYMAMQREIESSRKTNEEREAEILKLMNAVESFKTSIATHEKELDALRSAVKEQEVETNKRVSELQAVVDEQSKGRHDIVKEVKPEYLKRYETIRVRRGLAVVPARDGYCVGCNMNIPPQLYNILQRGSSLESCPNCNRIIYWEEPAQVSE
jgi:predicted  nucleic acid-binding Zn-ribbon protein